VPADPYAPPGQQNLPSTQDVNEHLPSSSKASTDTSRSADGFDVGPDAGSSKTVRGNKDGAFIVEGQNVPEVHDVKRGDTLWDISGKYYGNPYNWPRMWSLNNHISNPHWLYPGDQVRLRGGAGVRITGAFARQQPVVPPGTVFQPHLGYVLDGDPVPEDWGLVIGAPDDQMLLAANDNLYIKLADDKDVQVGQILTLWEEREVKNLAEDPLVWIRGIARVNRYNPKTHMARAEVIEALTEIERGIRVGPADRRIDIVQPVRNKKTIPARIVGALFPHEFYAQNQIVFIDKGSKHGVEVGNRFFAVSRGDRWRLGLATAGQMADDRAIIEDDAWARVEDTPDDDDPDLYPAETYAELRVMRVRETTASCLVTASVREIPRGALVVAREGY
jgi:LysM repeat protein